MYMNDQQQEQYNSRKKEIEDIKASLKLLPDLLKASVGSQLESRIGVLNREIRTLIDDTHKVTSTTTFTITAITITIGIILTTIYIIIRYQH
jgi:hypothetical protein